MNSPFDISSHEKWFHNYVDTFVDGGLWVKKNQQPWGESDSEHIELKRHHSMRVLENCRVIVASLSLPPDLHRALLLAALYHDVGRFYQYSRYRTFADIKSENHGTLGCRILNQENPLRSEPISIQKIVKGAVVLHNRLNLPTGLSEDLRTAAFVVRDSDKLDIVTVMLNFFVSPSQENSVVSLHAENEPTKWSQSILDALLERRVSFYNDIRYQNDFKILICSWVFDLNFAKSRRMMQENGALEKIMSLWPVDIRLEPAKEIIREALSA